jgi:hypothetical protein
MPPQKSSFSIYINPKISPGPENSCLSTPEGPPSKKPRIEVKVPTLTLNWLREPLREVAPNFARPTDPAWTIVRLPDRKVTLGSLKKWQKKQPNDHTSKLFIYFFIYFIFILFYYYIFYLYKYLTFTNYFYRSMAS